jgi:3-carboxy-cis,cis-muconate cycloisomerase
MSMGGGMNTRGGADMTTSAGMDDPRDALYTTQAMAAAFSPAAHIRQMLAFEAALARAEARAGVIPATAAEAIAAACQADDVDVAALYREAAQAGTPAIPLVRMLTVRVAEQGRAYVHWGATSQDAIDTATVLQMREGLTLLEADLLRLGASCAELASAHRRTLMAGRTLLQQALPIPFGLKAARWLGLVTRQTRALREQRRALALQCGGAAGTLAALGDQGLQVAALLAEELALALPDLPWHAERDRVANVAAALGVTVGAMAKIAQDVTLLAQSEVGEVAEASAPGKGGSSAMPQKRNPVDATLALAAARLALGQVPLLMAAMVQEHERAAGAWQAEWAALPALFRYAAGAVSHVERCVAGLEIDVQRMTANLAQSGGVLMAEALTMALAPHLGRPEAQRVGQEVCARAVKRGQPLQQAVLDDERVSAILSPEAIERALDPSGYLGSADALIDRALEGYRVLVGES